MHCEVVPVLVPVFAVGAGIGDLAGGIPRHFGQRIVKRAIFCPVLGIRGEWLTPNCE
jgi:hypothetical protein